MKGFELNIGRACNSRCQFCVSRLVSKEEKVWLPLERAREEVQRAYQEGCRSLGFVGGEPTVYPHLLEVVRYGRELGYQRVALATNGMALSRRDFLERLIAAGVSRCGVSIHSHRPEIEDELTRVKGAFARKVTGLKLLVEMRDRGRLPDNVSVNPLLHRLVVGRLPALVRFFARLGIDDVRFNTLRPVTGGPEDRRLCPRFSQAMPKVWQLVLLNEQKLGMHITFGDFPSCVWPWQMLANRAWRERYTGERHDLQTRVAIFKDARRTDRQPERFLWSDVKRNTLKAKLETCAGCAWDAHCEGFWRSYLDLYGTSEVQPPVGVYPD